MSRLVPENKPQSHARIRPSLPDIPVNSSRPFAASEKAQVVKGLKFNKLKAGEYVLQQLLSITRIMNADSSYRL